MAGEWSLMQRCGFLPPGGADEAGEALLSQPSRSMSFCECLVSHTVISNTALWNSIPFEAIRVGEKPATGSTKRCGNNPINTQKESHAGGMTVQKGFRYNVWLQKVAMDPPFILNRIGLSERLKRRHWFFSRNWILGFLSKVWILQVAVHSDLDRLVFPAWISGGLSLDLDRTVFRVFLVFRRILAFVDRNTKMAGGMPGSNHSGQKTAFIRRTHGGFDEWQPKGETGVTSNKKGSRMHRFPFLNRSAASYRNRWMLYSFDCSLEPSPIAACISLIRALRV